MDFIKNPTKIPAPSNLTEGPVYRKLLLIILESVCLCKSVLCGVVYSSALIGVANDDNSVKLLLVAFHKTLIGSDSE